MAGIFDLLKMLAGQGGQPDPNGPPSPMPAGDNVGALLSGNATAGEPPQADPNAPAQVPPPQVAQAPVQPNGPLQQPPAGPVTPPSTDNGLGGFLSRMVQKATTRDPDSGMSFMDKLGNVGAQMTDQMGDSQGAQDRLQGQAAQRVAAVAADAKHQQMNALAAQLGMSPREKLIFLANPDAWIKANEPRLGVHDIAEGAQAHYGDPGSADSHTITAPKFGQEKGEGYAVTPDTVKDLGGLQPSPQQQLENTVKQAQEKALDAYHQHMARAAEERAHAATTNANRPRAALGNGGDWRSRVVGQGSVP